MLTCMLLDYPLELNSNEEMFQKTLSFLKIVHSFFYHCFYFKKKKDSGKTVILSAFQHLTPGLVSVKLLRVILPAPDNLNRLSTLHETLGHT